MIEKDFDVPFVADLALREKQIQQNYRPIIGVHKWFARRPGTLFRSLLLAEFSAPPLRAAFYQSHHLPDVHVLDPFMGGGTPLIEANRVGCQVTGYDVNPMAYWVVRQELSYLNVTRYVQATERLGDTLGGIVGDLYQTTCMHCGSPAAKVKYFLWVKTQRCERCGGEIELFPGYLVAENRRHPLNVIVCAACGQLNEVSNRYQPGSCRSCGAPLSVAGPASRNQCRCPHCSYLNRFPSASHGVPHHKMFAIEYYCPACKERHEGRFFKTPDGADTARYQTAQERLSTTETHYIPDEAIPAGDETTRLLRWGYQRYSDLFNARQLLGLATLSHLIAQEEDDRIRYALATNLSDLLRYQNMLCRYDTGALKSLDVFSVHGFPVGLIQCESNLLGVQDPDRGIAIGSGGWLNITQKYARAKEYCAGPFEVIHEAKRKHRVRIRGEWIGDRRGDEDHDARRVDLSCSDASQRRVPVDSVDAVFTDPPYYGNVQYAELMDFCYVWLRRLLGAEVKEFVAPTTRTMSELTVNGNYGRDLSHFTAGLSAAFRNAAAALKPGAPFAFTYHHNDLGAYLPVAVALLDSQLVCTAALPCPAEMAASIHISGTRSSVVDTVFVCRTTGRVRRALIADSPDALLDIVRSDAINLHAGGLEPSLGDLRCLAFGHLVRLAVWALRTGWTFSDSPLARTQKVLDWVTAFVSPEQLESDLGALAGDTFAQPLLLREQQSPYLEDDDEISF